MSDEPRTIAPCVCTDPDVERLRELIAGGMEQREASGVLWGAETGRGATNSPAPGVSTSLEFSGRQIGENE